MRQDMKKTLIFLAIALPGFAALLFNLSCSATQPTAATNFQNPVLTVVSINTPFTATFTSTPTFTPTITTTNTPSSTPTPFATNTPWTGFSAPSGVAVDGAGNVFVADTGNSLVKKYYPNGLLNPSWGLGVRGKVAVAGPVGVAVNSAGTTVYVIGSTTLSVYLGNGSLLTQVTTAGSTTFLGPEGLAVDTGGNVYVSDTGHNRIVKLTYTGTYSSSFSTAVSVLGIAVDSSGDVFGAAGNNILEFTSAGTGTVIATIPGFTNPAAVALDSSNNLYVADTGNHQVEEFLSGQLAAQPVVIFNNGGQMVSPKGVAVDGSGNIYVSDSTANNVLKFVP